MEDKLNHTAPYSKQRYRQHFMKYFLNGPLKWNWTDKVEYGQGFLFNWKLRNHRKMNV